MVKVTKARNTIHITGHAGYDVEGKDIVCAGVSASAQLIADILKSITETDVYKQKGDLYIMYTKGVHPDIVVSKFMTQMKNMELQYPEHIEVVEVK